MKNAFRSVLATILVIVVGVCLFNYSNHRGMARTPNSSVGMRGVTIDDALSTFEKNKFTNIESVAMDDLVRGWHNVEGGVDHVTVDGDEDYVENTWYPKDVPVVIYYHTFKDEGEDGPGEDLDIVEMAEIYQDEIAAEGIKVNGSEGIFAYKSMAAGSSSYWILDFDEGYAYFFVDDDMLTICVKLAITSGDLNSVVIVPFHNDDNVYYYSLYFKYADDPEYMIEEDSDGNKYDYEATDVAAAVELRDKKDITDY